MFPITESVALLSLATVRPLNGEQVEALLTAFGAVRRWIDTNPGTEVSELKEVEARLQSLAINGQLPTAEDELQKLKVVIRKLDLTRLQEPGADESTRPNPDKVAWRLNSLEDADNVLSRLHALRVLGLEDVVQTARQWSWRVGKDIRRDLNTATIQMFLKVVREAMDDRRLEIDPIGQPMWITLTNPDRAAEMLAQFA